MHPLNPLGFPAILGLLFRYGFCFGDNGCGGERPFTVFERYFIATENKKIIKANFLFTVGGLAEWVQDNLPHLLQCMSLFVALLLRKYNPATISGTSGSAAGQGLQKVSIQCVQT